MNFIIDLVIYPFDIMVSVSETDNEFKRAVKDYDIKDDSIANFKKHPISLARTTMLEGGQTIIRLRRYDGTAEQRGTVAHEIFHATIFILNRIGMDLTLESDEAYAYLNQYITEKMYEQLSEYNECG